MERSLRLLFQGAVIALILLLAGCGGGMAPVEDNGHGPAPPGYYRIRRGDTLSEIAERKRIGLRKLAAWNRLRPPYPIYAGKLLRIEPPGREAVVQSSPGKAGSGAAASRKVSGRKGSSPGKSAKTSIASKQPAKPAARPTSVAPGSAAAGSGITWQWPVSGPVRQGFSAGDRTRQGLRIAVTPGGPVNAAADGSVVYSGSGLKGYGNLIIVKHSASYLSAYGFNRRLLAMEGNQVKRGQQIAEAGESADGQALLHFEIRRDGSAVDPLLYLPASR